MKKILSIVLAVIMAVSMAVPAFAVQERIVIDENITVGVESGGSIYLTFTAPDDGEYRLSFALESGVRSKISLSYGNYLIGDYDFSDNDDCDSGEFYFSAGEGQKFSVDLYNHDSSDSEISFVFEKYDCESITLGQKSFSDDETDEYYVFTADKDGFYNFKSVSDKADPSVIVYHNGEIVDSNDDNHRYDGGYYDYNFDLTVYLSAGETYFVNFFNSPGRSDNYSGYDVVISYGVKEPVEEIDIFVMFEDDRKINLPVGTEYDIRVWAVPTGSLPTADVNITSSNEKVVQIRDYDEKNGNITIYSNKPGISTITFEADGVTDKMKVRVLSDFEIFIVNIINEIHAFFAMLIHFFF